PLRLMPVGRRDQLEFWTGSRRDLRTFPNPQHPRPAVDAALRDVDVNPLIDQLLLAERQVCLTFSTMP
ncbi:MAG: hypothetical protein ACK5Q5_00855, partial [Planctomycetaceae bacterium]